MALNISFTAAPAITLTQDGVAVAAQAAMEMQVIDQGGERTGVAAIGISATFEGAAYVRVRQAGSVPGDGQMTRGLCV